MLALIMTRKSIPAVNMPYNIINYLQFLIAATPKGVNPES
jgi:hypothetical protein